MPKNFKAKLGKIGIAGTGLAALVGGIFLNKDNISFANNHPQYEICYTYDKKEFNTNKAIEVDSGENFVIYEQPISSSKESCIRITLIGSLIEYFSN